MPDDVVFVDGIPHRDRQVLKTALRGSVQSYSFPTAAH